MSIFPYYFYYICRKSTKHIINTIYFFIIYFHLKSFSFFSKNNEKDFCYVESYYLLFQKKIIKF